MESLQALPINCLYNAVACPHVIHNAQVLQQNEKYNAKWRGLSFANWIASADHPVPVISLLSHSRILRYNNVHKLSLMEHKTIQHVPICLLTPLYYIRKKNSTSWILFRQNVDKFVSQKPSTISPTKFRRGTLLKLIKTANNIGDYCFCYNFEDNIVVLGIVRVMYIFNRNNHKKTNKAVGTKVTVEIVTKGRIESKKWLYTVSYSLGQHLIKAGYAVGNQAYCYNYIARYWHCGIKDHVYFIYDPLKKVKSIVKYYKASECVVSAQNKLCPSNCEIENDLSLTTPHKWWTGLVLQYNIIDQKYKNVLYDNVMNSIKDGNYGHIDYSTNRIKLSFLYYYLYKNMSVNRKQSQIAQGLRVCQNQFVPDWLKDLVVHCKRQHFIPWNCAINQIGINIYYHQKQDSSKAIAFASIASHNNEQLKFLYVYSLTLYSDNFGTHSYLSFNLTQNCTNGELRVALPDCAGVEMCEGSWCLSNGTAHSVSKCELQILPKQWRIVFLFRVAHKHIWEEAKQFYFNNLKK